MCLFSKENEYRQETLLQDLRAPDRTTQWIQEMWLQVSSRCNRSFLWLKCWTWELLEAITEEGKEYQIEVTAFWDDKPDQDIRVTAVVLPVPLQPLFGFITISIYFGEAGDGFIIRPDGSFVDEWVPNNMAKA